MTDFFFKSWAEFIFFVLMVIGFIVALWASTFSAVISYIVIFLSGMVGGRLLYRIDGLSPMALSRPCTG